MINLSRRGMVGGMLALFAAPAIIRTEGLLMPIKPVLVAPEVKLEVDIMELSRGIWSQNIIDTMKGAIGMEFQGRIWSQVDLEDLQRRRDKLNEIWRDIDAGKIVRMRRVA